MKKYLSIILSVVLTAIITFTGTVVVLSRYFYPPRESVYPDILTEIKEYIDRYAVFEFSEEDSEKALIYGYLSALNDGFSFYWTAEEYAQQLSSNEGNFTGIGVSLQTSDPISGGLFVYRVLGNSPAQTAGIQPGDVIVAVNGKDVEGRSYDDVYNEMGVAVNSSLVLTVNRGEETLQISVEFKEFVQKYVDYRMIGDVGFIRIHSFMMPAVAEFEAALNDLLAKGAKSFIFDLRNNLGGNLDCVEQIVSYLIPKGEETVVLQFKNNEEVHYSKGERKTDAPMVVLMNESSASASELMASCLRDINKSLLIGTKSYGKGVGQSTFELSDDSAVKFTTFHYLTKGRVHYDGVGLTPDQTVTLTEDQEKYFYTLDETNDPQLQAALAALAK